MKIQFAALTHNVPNLPKPLGNICLRKSMLKSFRNQHKTLKETNFGQD